MVLQAGSCFSLHFGFWCFAYLEAPASCCFSGQQGTSDVMPEKVADALARRSAQRQATFVLPYLRPGRSLLDCGCGPGSITCDIARLTVPGKVIGVDANPAQIERASAHALADHISNVTFQTASVYELPFPNAHFDVVFAHALFQHLADPDRAMTEMCRVLVPNGIIALRSPDWGGLLIAPRTADLTRAMESFLRVYYADGDAFAGSNGPSLLRRVGVAEVTFTTTVEREEPSGLGEFAAAKLTVPELASEAACLRAWARNPDALFVQVWGEVVGRWPS